MAMAENDPTDRNPGGRTTPDPDSREARRAAALRVNLRRRKQAQRAARAGEEAQRDPAKDMD